MLLTVDRGNTSLDVMLHGDPPQRWRAKASEPAEVLAAIAALPPPMSRAVGSTVVAGGLEVIAGLLLRRGVRLELAGHDLPCPLALAYPEPSTLGSDRWVAALGAWRLTGAAIVVQCGTAITTDAVDETGRFLGGAIAPGLHAMARGLAASAPRLPIFGGVRDIAVPAVTSQDCVEAGVGLAFCGAIERLVADLLGVLPAAALLITGGAAPTYLRRGHLAFTHVPDLLHQGLRCLAQASTPRS